MKIYNWHIPILIIILLLPSNIGAYNLRQISNREGLSNSAILSIYQDYDGFMWFGSCDGLNMFNGLNTQVYKPTDEKNNLSGNLIENIIETEKGILWVYTNYGLNRLDKQRQSIESYNQFKGRYFIQKDSNNSIYIINSDNCISYYHSESRSFKETKVKGLNYSRILNFIISSNDVLWIITTDGSNPGYKINRNEKGEVSLTPYRKFDHPAPLLHCSFEKDSKDVFYFIDSTHTLYEANLKEEKRYYISNLKEEIVKNGDISSIIKHHSDYFVGFKTNGLIKIKSIPDKPQKYQTENIDIKAGIFCLFKDRYQDLIWVGTDGQGVYMYSDDAYSMKSTLFTNFAGYIEKPARAIFLDHENSLWIGTKGDGILRIQDYEFDKNLSRSKIEHISANNSLLNDNSVYAFSPSCKNILWIGGEEGLSYYSYKDKSIRRIPLTAEGKTVKHIHSILEEGDSALWIATVGGGIVKAKLSGTIGNPMLSDVKRITVHEGNESSNYFFTIYKEKNNTIWFGNRGYGAFSIKPNDTTVNSLLLDQETGNQTMNDVFSIIQDHKNNYWFGTSFGLVKKSTDGSIRIFSQKDGLPNNTIHGILADTRGNLWLSTNGGIVRFNIEKEDFHSYTYLNGLQVIEFSDNAFFRDEQSGTLFFGGINGFVSIQETNATPKIFLPQIHFDNLMIFGQKKNIFDYFYLGEKEKTLKLNYNQNFFSISFTALDYINGNNYTYYYKLGSHSEQWINNGASNSISFTSLSPGKYILYTKYKDSITGNESAVYSIIIEIRPPWYMSWWAYTIYALALAMTIVFIIRSLRIRSKKRKQEAMLKLQQQHQEEVYESKLQFFTNIAHEFCTPLTLIYGPCSRILSHNGSDRFVRKYTQLIQRNAERLNTLIQELIEFKKIENGSKQPQIESVNVSEMIYDITESFNDLAESKNIHFEKDISDNIEWNSDKSFLYTVTINLISNAFRYTSTNGSIRIQITTQDDNLVIMVSNTGKGIKEEDLNHIFDRYSILDSFEKQEGKNESSRNGLGLAISNSMVKLLNGTIDVNSLLNKRTDFIVKLPKKEKSDRIIDINSASLETTLRTSYDSKIEIPEYQFDKTKPTVLIIDDDTEILWLISEIFAEEYNVIPVGKPLDAKEILQKIHPNIIICDVIMQDIDGIILAKEIKSDKKTAHIPMILISAKQTIEEQIEGLAAGAEMYITKPFNPDYLKTSARHLIDRKETLKDYFNSPLSAFELTEGKLTHKENTKFVQEIYDIIERNIMNKDLSAQFIAKELNMSSRHLYRKINETGSSSPIDMIKETRLHMAKNLLLNTKMTIDEVIYKSGFSNRATFFRAFSQKFDCTPKEYREREMYNL